MLLLLNMNPTYTICKYFLQDLGESDDTVKNLSLADHPNLGTTVIECFENLFDEEDDIAFPTITEISHQNKADATLQQFLIKVVVFIIECKL